ncbi:inositol phosphorylceramide synthase [Nostoc sp. FACHB-87]|uniref:phosphatase PAP2 family protein n=1 Tax=Nostocaceae TaxID=1162 RepID=UPI001686FE0C|nr:inositol phosphorylceramide synthase [Nostoc sp. FACHB-87]MBD2479347.1 inositol phosphorylceramide synthase [Anabaena sp. FACHB-83]
MNKLIYITLLGLSFLPYKFLNQRTGKIHILKLEIDRWIPLLPIFAIPYLLFIPFIVITLVYFILFSQFYKSITVAFTLCLLIAYGFYIFYPTTVPRPAIISTDFFSQLVAFIYTVDQPYNCFPSLHTSLSVLALLFWIQMFPNMLLPLGVFVLSILFSTLFTKQHHVPDVLSGMVLAILCFWISKFLAKPAIAFP